MESTEALDKKQNDEQSGTAENQEFGFLENDNPDEQAKPVQLDELKSKTVVRPVVEPPFAFAPDGFAPNSMVRKELDDWHKKHPNQFKAPTGLFFKKKTKEVETTQQQANANKSEIYKERLKKMMDKLQAEKEIVEKPIEPPPTVEPVPEPQPEPVLIKRSLPANEPYRPRALPRFQPVVKVPEQQSAPQPPPPPAIVEIYIIPDIILKALAYKWLREDDVYEPIPEINPDLIQEGYKEPPRKVKIEATIDKLTELALTRFKESNDFQVRSSVLSFLVWAVSEQGYKNVNGK